MAKREVRTRADLERLFDRLADRLRRLEGERGSKRWRETRAVLSKVQQDLLATTMGVKRWTASSDPE